MVQLRRQQTKHRPWCNKELIMIISRQCKGYEAITRLIGELYENDHPDKERRRIYLGIILGHCHKTGV